MLNHSAPCVTAKSSISPLKGTPTLPLKGTPTLPLKGTLILPLKGTLILPLKGALIPPFKGSLNLKSWALVEGLDAKESPLGV